MSILANLTPSVIEGAGDTISNAANNTAKGIRKRVVGLFRRKKTKEDTKKTTRQTPDSPEDSKKAYQKFGIQQVGLGALAGGGLLTSVVAGRRAQKLKTLGDATANVLGKSKRRRINKRVLQSWRNYDQGQKVNKKISTAGKVVTGVGAIGLGTNWIRKRLTPPSD
jgi:hypothetical protein